MTCRRSRWWAAWAGVVTAAFLGLGPGLTAATASSNSALAAAVTQAPVITSAPAVTFVSGVPASFTVTSTGTPVPSLVEHGALPQGITFKDLGNASATLSGTPVAGTVSSYPITIVAVGADGAKARQSFTLTLRRPPAITSAATAPFVYNEETSFAVVSEGAPVPVLSETGALPTGLTFKVDPDGKATLSGTPTQDGSFPLTVVAANGVAPDATQQLVVSVRQGTAFTTPATATFTVGSAGTFTVSTTGAPVATLSVQGALPAGVTFVPAANGQATLSGTATQTGAFPFVINATKAATPGVAPAEVVSQHFVLSVDQAPAVTSPAAATFASGAAGTFMITTTGYPVPALSEQGALPGGLTFKDNRNGTATLAGTPAAGAEGTYPITVVAINATQGTATETLTISVQGTPIITSAATVTFEAGKASTFTFTSTGLPAPTLSEHGALPQGVTFGTLGNGDATITGSAEQTGTFVITITAANGVGSTFQSFTLDVHRQVAFTTPASVRFVYGTSKTFTITAAGFPTPTLTEAGILPTGVTFAAGTDGSAMLTGAPTETGVFVVDITADNGTGTPAVQDIKLTSAPTPTSLTLADGLTKTKGRSPLTLTATVSASRSTPTGSVTFTDGSTKIGTAAVDGSGVATLPVKLATGVHTLAAAFSPTAGTGFAGSTATTLTYTVAPPSKGFLPLVGGNTAEQAVGLALVVIVLGAAAAVIVIRLRRRA